MNKNQRISVFWRRIAFLLLAGSVALSVRPGLAGNFYAGTSPATVPWPGGIVPYVFSNSVSTAQRPTYLDGLREWELAAGVKFVPYTNQARYIVFSYNTNYFDNVSPGYSPQVVSVSSLSRSQVGHEMGHSFGLTHENIRIDQTNYLIVLSNNVTPGNLVWFQIDPSSVTNGNYDFESVMHLGRDFASIQPGVLDTQQPKPPYARFQPRMGNLALSPGDRAALAFLYGPPTVPLTNVVTTTADAGPGSLRAAIYYLTDHPGAVARFNIPTNDPGYSNSVFTIHLTGHLPPLVANGMVIDGSTQPGFATNPIIVVDGSQILPEEFTSITGLLLYSANNQVKNVAFQGFNWNGLTMLYPDATNNTISGCWSGLGSTGTNAAPNAYQGILISDGASRNIVGGTNALARNVLSGNSQYGIFIAGTNTTGNIVLGNYIGTDATGMTPVTNASGGAIILNGSEANLIGGTNANARNVISGNPNFGVWIGAATNNTVQGNWIGLNANGTAALPNTFNGIYVIDGAQSNWITGNVLSGNDSEGIRLAGAGTSANLVQGNFIGTDWTGTNAIPNGFAGLTFFAGATGNIAGGTTAATRNVISGNGSYGVVIGNAGTSGNVVQGNYIGLAPDGSTPVPNFHGVLVSDGATGNTLGGTSGAARNVIAGNNGDGVFLTDAGTTGNFIEGNFIGTDATGANAVRNGYEGIYLVSAASGNVIGGTAAGAGNVISGNTLRGIYAYGTNISGNLIQGNLIGLKADGTNALGNGWDGVVFFDGASSNVVGLDTSGAGRGNTIAFNGFTGIYIGSDNTDVSVGNTLRGNAIFSNGYLGINLAGGTEDSFGVTANHPGGAVPGPNDLQNYPVFTSATVSGSSTILSGTFNCTASHAFVLDFYRNSNPDPSGYGEGQFYLGSTTATTDGSGNAIFGFGLSGNFTNQNFTATATDLVTGDTSEFGADILATSAPGLPTFTGPYSRSSTGFTARISLGIGQSYHIQATTNLSVNPVPWVNLTNFLAASSPFPFTDPSATNYRTRFYRVVSP